jgi:hypothetical protein
MSTTTTNAKHDDHLAIVHRFYTSTDSSRVDMWRVTQTGDCEPESVMKACEFLQSLIDDIAGHHSYHPWTVVARWPDRAEQPRVFAVRIVEPRIMVVERDQPPVFPAEAMELSLPSDRRDHKWVWRLAHELVALLEQSGTPLEWKRPVQSAAEPRKHVWP